MTGGSAHQAIRRIRIRVNEESQNSRGSSPTADNACLAGMAAGWFLNIRGTSMRCLTLLAGLLSTLLVSAPAGWGASPAIEVVLGDGTVMLPRSELLQRADLTEVRIPRDPTYKQPMKYRALPLASLLHGLPLKPDEVIEVVATDGFVTLLPSDLVFAKNDTASAPYLAIEPPDEPWPVIPGKTASAGPFYVVWFKPEASGVRSEQWPYAVASFRSAEPPERRWPALAADPKVPADSPIRAGQALFITQCLVCHTLNGAGNAHVGPDLNGTSFCGDS
jgi:Cytochrome c